MQQVQHKNVYRVTSFGVDIEFTGSLREAQDAYKESQTAELWKVNGPVLQLLAKKRQYTPMNSSLR